LLNKLWEISSAIKDQKIIEIGYSRLGADGKVENDIITRHIRSQGILFSEYYFYLIGFIEGKNYEYPTIFRVDRIKELRITDKKFEVNYSQRFEDGEFRKYIQFMQSGELERIKFSIYRRFN
jgi:predicted DNA-binding transcriptional regulator YafY